MIIIIIFPQALQYLICSHNTIKPLRAGSVRVHGSVAFCDQRPWILNDTVQGNVLFGHEYDEARFDAALYASSLEDDVTILPGGVNTQIGECRCFVASI